mgnify:CR=1 FL=1
MKISDNVYQQLMSQAADKMTELYDKVKSRDDEIATLRAQLAEAKKYPELRCNHCDKVLTATWIDDDLGRFALIDKCYCG